MTKKLTKVAMTTALAAAAIVPAVVATPAQAAEAEVTFAKAYYTTANGTAAFDAGKLGGVVSATGNKDVIYLEGSNGEVFEMKTFSAYFAANPTATTDEVLTALSTAGKALSADQVKALNVKEGKVEGGKVTADADAPVGDVKVESVKAINPTTIQVTLNKDLTTEQANKANFTLSKGTVEAVKVEGKVATLSVKGLTFGNTTTVTVGNPAHTTEVTVPQVNELYVLEVTTDAANDTIKSDGATKTQLTVVLKDRTTGEIVEKDGVIQFQATRGGLGQTTSALQNGKATVQLTSVASATSMTSIVTATVSDVPGAAEFEGLTAQKAVIFSPDAKEAETKFVQALAAESTQGDRLHVQFSDKISAADYKKAIADKAATKGKPTSLEYGIEVDGKTVAVKDVVNLTDNTLEFILDVDHANPSPSSHERIEQTPTWATGPAVAGQKNYLRDNVTHTVKFPANIGGLVLATTAGLDFILTDTSRPAVLGVTAKDQLEFNVRFTESVDERTVEAAPENFLIDGREVQSILVPTPTEIATAKAQNKIIVTSLKVGEYTFDKDGKPVDQRNIVTFKVHKDFVLSEGVHQIQVAKVTDWAGDVDPVQNTVATDTFDFTVTADKTVPAPTIEVQSPEQWKVTFDKEVYGTTGKKIKDVFAIKSADSNDSFVMDTDYIVSYINADGTTGTPLLADDLASKLDGQKHFLIEFKQDWTEKYDTNNNPEKTYFASTKNPYTVTVDNVESAIGNKMAKQDLDVKLSYDGVSPTIAKAEQEKDNGVLKQSVRVQMTEPVKNVDGNNEGLTPSQDQTAGVGGVPVPTYEFVKGDKVVKAKAENGSYDNYGFTLTPDTTLEAGEWTLYIRSISDDIGNTSATVSTKVTIAATESAVSNTQLAWAAFDDAAGTGKLINNDVANNYDVVYVKFTKVMKSDGTNGVSRTQNYVFMGQPLPQGSQVLKGISGVTQDWDGVTIIMPKDTWNGTGTGNNDFTTSLNIASNFVAADGEALSGAYEVELSDTTTTSGTGADDAVEALYKAKADDKVGNIFNGAAAVVGATASTTASVNAGKIDTITLSLAPGTAEIPTDTEILVNGKKFKTAAVTAANATTATFTAVAGQEIEATVTNNLKITATDGSIIVNTNSVKDGVAPVITKAELNTAKDKITLTFSEAVTNATDGTFDKVVSGSFTFPDGTVTAVEHDSSTPNKVVLTITDGATLTTASTIAAKTDVKDFAGTDASTDAFSPIKGALLVGPAAPAVTGGVTEITGIVAGLEYRLVGATSFTAVTGAEVTAGKVTSLPAGNYEVRVAQTATHGAGAIETVTVTPSGPITTGIAGSNLETTAGVAPTTGTAEVNTLTIVNDASVDGNITVTFNDGGSDVAKTVAVTNGETAAQVAAKIATAFTGTTGWTVANVGDTVTFTATTPAADKNVTVTTVDTGATGVGTPSASQTTAGVAPTTGTAEVNTFTVTGPATATGNVTVTFNDGGTDVVKTVAVTNGETAAQVAANIATAFTGTTGWTVANVGDTVTFTANPIAADKTVTIVLANS